MRHDANREIFDVADGADIGERALAHDVANTANASAMVVVAANSLLQFVPFSVTENSLRETRRRFVEVPAPEGDAVLQVLDWSDDLPGDAIEHRIDGASAAAFLSGHWLPLPCRRFLRDGRPDRDGGPSNWMRLRIDSDGVDGFSGVLAFDTASGREDRGEHMPTRDDVARGVTFRCAVGVDDLAAFVSEPWVDDWLAACELPAHGDMDESSPQPRLTALANYLVLLQALQAADLLPDVGVDQVAETATPVELVITLGHDTSAAVYVDRQALPVRERGALQYVPIRDLASPRDCHYGAIPAAVCFQRPSFGDDRLSRLSGRTDAFQWPGLARIGAEAGRLLNEASIDAPPNGLRQPLDHISDLAAHAQIWRFAETGSVRQAFVSGPLLGKLTETGDRRADDSPVPPAVRARFAAGSLLTFAVMEHVFHAVAGLNAAVRVPAGAAAPKHRRLASITFQLPPDLTQAERRDAERRIRDGVELAFGCIGDGRTGATVRFCSTSATAISDAFVHHEIQHRFAGRRDAYFDAIGHGRATGEKRLRIGSIDLADAAVTLSIGDIAAGRGASGVVAKTLLADSAGIGGAMLLDAVAAEFVVPAWVDDLQRSRLHDASGFLRRHLTDDASANSLGARLRDEVLRPAAFALVQQFDLARTSARTTVVEVPLASLVAGGGEPMRQLQELALAAGANRTQLQQTRLRVSGDRVQAIVAARLTPVLRCCGRVLRNAGVDVVLLAGRFAKLSMVRDVLLAERAARPDRIVTVAKHRFDAWRDVCPVGRAVDMGLFAAAGAVLAADEPTAAPASWFIGIASEDGSMAPADVLFSHSDAAGPRTATISVADRVDLSGRGIAAKDWPARHLATVALADADVLRRHSGPFTVVLELDAERFPSVRAVKDARGRDLAPDVVVVTGAGGRR